MNSNSITAEPLLNDLSGLILRHVQERPDSAAVGSSDLRTVLTYRRLDILIQSAMAQFSGLGLKRGDTVALLSDNCVEFVLALLAITSLGARAAPLNPAINRTELRRRLSQLSPRAVLVPRHLAERAEIHAEIGAPARAWIMDIQGAGSSYEVRIADTAGGTPSTVRAPLRVPIAPNDIALLMFTGGTTGAPKIVPLTHRNIMASIDNIARSYALSQDDVTLLVMPLFHGHGLIAGLLTTLATGGAAYVTTTGAFSAHMFWPDAVRLGVTWYTAAPTIHVILLNRAANEYPGPSRVKLRFIRSCSAPLDDKLAAETTAAFGVQLISAYGMTEASHQVASNPLSGYGAGKASSVGLPTGTEVRIVGEDGQDLTTGAIGELWLRGPTVTTGYLNNPEVNAASFVNGWFRTGDLGSRDAEGFIFLKGRLKEIINRGGEKIVPSDVEAVLLSHTKVLEAMAFGEADRKYGEIVQAAVILRPGSSATENELREHCLTRMTPFEVPDRIHIVADFPRTAKGSPDRRALAARFASPVVA